MDDPGVAHENAPAPQIANTAAGHRHPSRSPQKIGDGRLVFPGLRSIEVAMSGGTMIAALRRMGYAKEEVTPLKFRASAATLLNECGKWLPDAIERQLDHTEENEVRRAFTRGDYWEQRIERIQWRADHLDPLKKPARPKISEQPIDGGRDYIFISK